MAENQWTPAYVLTHAGEDGPLAEELRHWTIVKVNETDVKLTLRDPE